MKRNQPDFVFVKTIGLGQRKGQSLNPDEPGAF